MELLRGEIVDFEMEGQGRRKIRFLNPELELFNTRRSDPAASVGLRPAHPPRSTARLAAGWIDFVGNVEAGIREVEGRDAPGLARRGAPR